MKMLLSCILLVVMTISCVRGQIIKFNPGNDTTKTFTLEGYADVYYGFDFNQPKDGNRPYFVSHHRHNEANINLAYISVKYNSSRARATFTPGFGTYMNANYAAERQTLQNMVEANVGVKVFKKRNIWIDAGIFTAPYTTETAFAFDQLLYTRSFAAEYSPYYLTGVKATLPLGEKFSLYLCLVNGWQVISDFNSSLAFVSALEYKPNDKLTINWSTYFGNEETPISPQNRERYFMDLYFIYKPLEKLTLSLDIYGGVQNFSDSVEGNVSDNWGQANLNAQYAINKFNAISARCEYYRDYHGIFIIPITGVRGFDCASFSLGYTRTITDNVQFRLEGRYFNSSRFVFYNDDLASVDYSTLLIGGFVARF